jgi:hypothetical protein
LAVGQPLEHAVEIGLLEHVGGGGGLVDGAVAQVVEERAVPELHRGVDPSRLAAQAVEAFAVEGAPVDEATPAADVLEQADLYGVLERLPDGQQTSLGEGGGLVSGGEGQRVRFGRALLRRDARLVLLDEPFRGLDRDRRSALLARARQVWRRATMLCVTHDVGETLGFERVIVVEGGRIVEDGSPAELSQNADSRYRALLDAERLVRQGLWSDGAWRRLRIEQGHLRELPPGEAP